MKIVVCYKSVPEEEDIVVRPDQSLSFDTANWKVGQYDLNAAEEALRLKRKLGDDCEVVALTVGGDIVDNSKMKKSILSRGFQQMYGVMDPSLQDTDSFTIASALKAGIEKIGDVDLVLCGEGSGDIYAQQVGIVLGFLLGYPTLNAVGKIDLNSGRLFVERVLEKEVEVLELPLPAVISVTTDINIPAIPGLKDIMAAGKKATTIWSLDDVGLHQDHKNEMISTLAPNKTERKNIIIEGDDNEAISQLYEHLRKIV